MVNDCVTDSVLGTAWRKFLPAYLGSKERKKFKKVKTTLANIIKKEIEEHMVGTSEVMNTNESLCMALADYKIQKHRNFFSRLLESAKIPAAHIEYRGTVLHNKRLLAEPKIPINQLSKRYGLPKLAEDKKVLALTIRQEIIDHIEGESAILNDNKSLCNALLNYEIRNHDCFIGKLLKEYVEPELRAYRYLVFIQKASIETAGLDYDTYQRRTTRAMIDCRIKWKRRKRYAKYSKKA
tara:strand:- start:629 stop:1342 length:714 start_codon:yes stop_codon:yes gene_type:complete